jgi:phosphoribosylamine--glycine ligase
MRILGVGQSCDLGHMYLRLQAQGHDVRVWSRDLAEHGIMSGMLQHVDDWRSELAWIRQGKGLILFETVEHGHEQDELRRQGFAVIGGSALGDRLENERAFGQDALAAAGLQSARSHGFDDFAAGIAFVQAHPSRYVFKLDGSETAAWRNYVGRAVDGSDVIALLRVQQARLAAIGIARASFVLMEHLQGVETGIGAYFNGQDFLIPACLDWEHKRFFPADLGELTGEMGTLVTYADSQCLFDQTLAKLAPLLREGGYVGYINLNTIINEQGIWPLELTCRFGYPGAAILDALQPAGWPALFGTMLRRDSLHFATAPGYAVGVVLNVPPFPYRYGYGEISRGLPITFDSTLSEREHAHLHFGEVARNAEGQLVTSGLTGYLMVATGTGATVAEAQMAAYDLSARVFVPNVRYRNDIGQAFVNTGHAKLLELGYLTR